MQTLEAPPQIPLLEAPGQEEVLPQMRGKHLQGDMTVVSNPYWGDKQRTQIVDVVHPSASGELIKEQITLDEAHQLESVIGKTPMLSR